MPIWQRNTTPNTWPTAPTTVWRNADARTPDQLFAPAGDTDLAAGVQPVDDLDCQSSIGGGDDARVRQRPLRDYRLRLHQTA